MTSSISRFVAAYGCALLSASLSAMVPFVAHGIVVGVPFRIDELLDLFLFCAIYSVVGVTLIGPLGFLLLRRDRRTRARDWVIVGAILGTGGMTVFNSFNGSAINLLVPVATFAGAGSAFGFWRVWAPRADSA